MSNSLPPHDCKHARPPCPSQTPRVYTNLCPLSQWYHPTISSSVIPFSSCPQTFLASGSFPMSQLFNWGGQSIGVSTSASVLPMNTQDWSPLGWTGWISLQSKGLLRVFSNSSKASILRCSAFFTVQLSHPYMTPGKTIALTRRTFVGKVSFLGGIQHSPVDGCSAASCNLWSSRRRWALVLLLCHLVVKGIEH